MVQKKKAIVHGVILAISELALLYKREFQELRMFRESFTLKTSLEGKKQPSTHLIGKLVLREMDLN